MARVRFPFCLEVVIYVAAVAVASSHGAHAHSVPAKLGPTDPHYMMLVSSGCSGSSWVWSTIVHVIEAHWRRNQSSVLPVLLGPVRKGDAPGSEKEWLDSPRFCIPPVEGEAEALRARSVCETGLAGAVPVQVQCRQVARLGDAWAGMNGGCGSHIDPELVRPAELGRDVPLRPGQRYVMPLSALMFQLKPEAWDMLTHRNTRVAASVKRNALDQLICMIKDCFDDKTGIPVDATGIRRKECFGRRHLGLKDTELKVKFDQARLLDRLDEMDLKRSRVTAWWLQPNYLDHGHSPYFGPDGRYDGSDGLPSGFGKPTPNADQLLPGEYFEASVEDLTAFEFTAPGVAGSTEETMHQRAWDRSIRSWTTLLESLGAPNDPAIVKGVLRLAMKGRAPRRHHSHTETIFAPEEIKALLHGTPHAWMWRD